MNSAAAIRRYRRSGHKVTPQRVAVLRALEALRGRHPAASDILALVRREQPRVSPATVYRILHELCDMGQAVALDLGDGRARFDINPVPHAHLVCEACGRVEDLLWSLDLTRVPDRLRKGFLVTGAQVTLVGRCPACHRGEVTAIPSG